jgi:hypothetical protein
MSLVLMLGLGFAVFCVALVVYCFLVYGDLPDWFPYPLALLALGLFYVIEALSFVVHLPIHLNDVNDSDMGITPVFGFQRQHKAKPRCSTRGCVSLAAAPRGFGRDACRLAG